MTSNTSKFLRIAALFLFLCIIFFSFPSFCEGHGSHHDHHHDHEDEVIKEPPAYKYSAEANAAQSEASSARLKKPMSVQTLWLEALSATLIISIAPFLILFFVPLDHREDNEAVLRILLSFASGGLLGDAFLHLIPHALQPHAHSEDPHSHSHTHHDHDHGHEHSHDNTGMLVLGGILAFLILDKLMRWFKVGHDHGVHEHSPSSKKDTSEKSKKPEKSDNYDEDEHINETAFLNLIADFVHNLTDGLAVGASFLAGEAVGLVTTVTILLHEIPHEIGDFAILIQSGCSKKKAMLLQLVTALGAFVGTAIALWFHGVDTTKTSWALPFTAGGFIYIATVTIIPDLLKDTTFWQSVKEIFALIIGVSLMILVAQFE